MSPVPNIISASRGVAAPAMLFCPIFSLGFWVLYCWCGISDMIDGPIARRLKSVSGTGSKIDSVADLVFVICSAIAVLPSVDLPLWVWSWIAAIGVVKVAGIVIGSYRQKEFSIQHSMTNKLTGILLFCLPFAIVRFDALIPAVIVCILATFSLLEDYSVSCKRTEYHGANLKNRFISYGPQRAAQEPLQGPQGPHRPLQTDEPRLQPGRLQGG